MDLPVRRDVATQHVKDRPAQSAAVLAGYKFGNIAHYSLAASRDYFFWRAMDVAYVLHGGNFSSRHATKCSACLLCSRYWQNYRGYFNVKKGVSPFSGIQAS
ncbi:hypothetical protein J6590_002789 [Homalodisca vitripennis]|nr:hypothetical protein J6590_002789 [Homalodisca vitripennis]